MISYPETSIDDGHISYCKETKKHYIYDSSNESTNTGKWKELSKLSNGSGIVNVNNLSEDIQNFFNAIRKSETLRSDIESGHKSTLLVQLGNIAQRVGHSLKIDNQNGRILDQEGQQYWSRFYEPGWEMKL